MPTDQAHTCTVTMIARLVRRCLAFPAYALLIALAMPLAAEPALGPLTVLSVRSRDNRSVALAAGRAGESLFAVWDGMVEGQRRIIFRERLGGEWLPEILLDPEPAAQPNSASVATDANGNPWVAWRGRVEGRFQPVVATRIGSRWIRWLPTEGTLWARGDAEEVTIATTDSGLPCVAWQEAIGAGYRIRAAWLETETGQWIVSELSGATEGFGLYPAIVLTSATASVVWYRAEGADFTLVERPIGPGAADIPWATPVPGFDALPANRFPTILRDSTGRLAGLWYDEIGNADRVLLGLQGPPEYGRGLVMDRRPDAENREVAGAALRERRLIVAWVAESPDSGTEIMAATGVEAPLMQIRVSDGEKDWFARPTAAPLEGGAAVAWESSAEFGGSGDILFREIRL